MSLRRPSNLVAGLTGCFVVLTVLLLRKHWGTIGGDFYIGSDGAKTAASSVDDVHNGTLGFEKIFVVGLPSRTDRRDSMTLAAALSNLEIEFIDGVLGSTIPDKAVPSPPGLDRLPDPTIGSWRGHMNAIQEVVRRNLSSALILEDDADWDIRLRDQLASFALSTQALIQPLHSSTTNFADPTYPRPPKELETVVPQISLGRPPYTIAPKTSPYGDGWDVFWLGHCGMHFPFEDNPDIPKGRVVQANDETVPQQQYLWTLSNPNDVKEQYPNHTRVVHHVQDGICSLGYAVSQKGARQMLHELSKNFNAAFDILLRWFCEGVEGRRHHNCLTVQPGLFQHHRFAGLKSANSDISDHGEGVQEERTDVVRWSVRMNADAIMAGEPIIDQYPDE